METLANDFVNLPIIVTDYDAILRQPRTSSNANNNNNNSRSAPSTSPSSSSATSTRTSAQDQHWQTGFSDFADELWNRMTHGMKTKLREACVEVLKRTDDPSEEEKVRWVWDEDASFLD